MPESHESVLTDLKAGKFAPLYFLHGEEPFYIDQIADYIEDHALSPTEKGFNFTVLYGKEVKTKQVLTTASKFPMMAQRQLVIVREAQEIADFTNENIQKQLVSYGKKPIPSTILVLCWKNKKVDKRKAFYKAFGEGGVVVETKAVYDYKLPEWILGYCKQQQIAIKKSAANLLAEYIGNDLARIANELQKLLLNYEGTVEVTEELITKHIGISKEYNIFEFQSALARRDLYKLYKILDYFEANPKSNPTQMIVANLYRFTSNLIVAHATGARSKNDIKQKIPGTSFPMQMDLEAAVKNYPYPKAVNLVHWLQQTDTKSKGVESNGNDADILRDFVFRL